jgi:hypothetical protein
MPLGLPFDMVGLSGLCIELNTREAKIFFRRGLYDFVCVGVMLTKEKVACTILCTTYVKKIQPKTPSTLHFLGRMFEFLCMDVHFFL